MTECSYDYCLQKTYYSSGQSSYTQCIKSEKRFYSDKDCLVSCCSITNVGYFSVPAIYKCKAYYRLYWGLVPLYLLYMLALVFFPFFFMAVPPRLLEQLGEDIIRFLCLPCVEFYERWWVTRHGKRRRYVDDMNTNRNII